MYESTGPTLYSSSTLKPHGTTGNILLDINAVLASKTVFVRSTYNGVDQDSTAITVVITCPTHTAVALTIAAF